jgi:hypothetical protein
MEIYEFCRVQYNQLVSKTFKTVPNCMSDIIQHKYVPYLALPFFEMSYISKKMCLPDILPKDIDQYMSIWKNFADPEDDIIPVKKRYEIYINDIIKWSKDVTNKIIFRCAYKKFHHESFNTTDYESRKRKAFNLSLSSMILEKKIKKMNDSNNNNSLDKLLTASEIISLEENIELKSEQLSINSSNKSELIAYSNMLSASFEFIIKEHKSVREELFKYLNDNHIEIINTHEKYHQQCLQETEENIKKYNKILDHLTSILKENEQIDSIKVFNDNINSNVTYIKNRLDNEESIKLKKIQTINNCNFPKFFDQMMKSVKQRE